MFRHIRGTGTGRAGWTIIQSRVPHQSSCLSDVGRAPSSLQDVHLMRIALQYYQEVTIACDAGYIPRTSASSTGVTKCTRDLAGDCALRVLDVLFCVYA